MRKLPNYQLKLARQLRQRQTNSEAELWEHLRAKKLAGAKFRRQRPLGRYIADLCCDAAKLVIEIDGSVNEQVDQQEYDTIRANIINAWGYTILHFTPQEITTDITAVLTQITTALEQAAKSATNPAPKSPPLPPSEARRLRERGI